MACPPPVIPLQRGSSAVTGTLETALEGPRELGMETETFVGQVGWLLVFGFAVGNLEGDAVVLGHIPDQIAPERAVVGPPEEAIGDGRDVVVVGIVDRDTGVTVQVWRQIDESLDPAALVRIGFQVTASSVWRMPPLYVPSPCPVYTSPLNPNASPSIKMCQVHSKVDGGSPHVGNNPSRRLGGMAVLRSWPATPETPTSKGRCVSRPMPMGAGFPKPRAMRPSKFGRPLSSSRAVWNLEVPSGSLIAAWRVNWESLPTGRTSTRIWPLMLLPARPEPPKPEKGRTVGKPGAKTSNYRPAANLQSSLSNSPYALF